jgi:hypothetical protein
MAREVISTHPGVSRKEMIAILVDRVGLTTAGASTYHYNITKKAANTETQPSRAEAVKTQVSFNKRGSKTATKKNLITYKNSHGAEPTSINSKCELTRALNWYNYIHEPVQSKEWLIEYVTKHFPDKTAIFNRLDINNFGYTAGWIGRMILNGLNIDPETVNWLHSKINSYIDESATSDETLGRRPTDKISLYLPDFEDAVDRFYDGETEFSAYNYLTSNVVPQIYASRIAEYYRPWLEELEAAIKNTDPQIKEGYAHLTSTQKRARAAFIKAIIDDCSRYVGNTRKERKPRQKRATSNATKLKHFRYMSKHDALKLVSANPETIIGASQLFALNTKNNVLTVFNAKTGGLDVSRSSITNYDETTTKCKRVGRSLSTAVQTVLTGTKSMRNRVLDAVKTDFAGVIDRLNNDTILLKVVK